MDINSVIYLGHTWHLPLMCPTSELADGLEPHDTIYSAGRTVVASRVVGVGWRGVPGVAGRVGAGRVLYRVLTQPGADPSFEAYLMNYYIYLVHTAV